METLHSKRAPLEAGSKNILKDTEAIMAMAKAAVGRIPVLPGTAHR